MAYDYNPALASNNHSVVASIAAEKATKGMKVVRPSTEPDCALDFIRFAWEFRSLSDEGWADLVNSGAFDAFLGLVPTPELPAIFIRALKG